MGSGAKQKAKIQRRLNELRAGRYNRCWVCGSTSGTKTAREATGPLCKKCLEAGRTTPEVLEYEELKSRLARLNAGNA